MARQVTIKSNLVLYPWQRQVLNELQQSRRGYVHVIKAKRQVGKSTLLSVILLQTAINHSKCTSVCISPTLEQARKVYNGVKKVIEPTSLYKSNNDTYLRLALVNGSTILFKSAEQGVGLKGYTVTGVYCIDEAAYIPDSVFFDTLAWVNVSQAPIVMVSTPFHKTGFFYKYYTLGNENGNKVLSYDWSEFDTSALLPPEKLEEYRREVPATQFKTEFLGQFLDQEGGVFGDYSACISNEQPEAAEHARYFMGIDWGTGQGQDETAVTVFDDQKHMVALYHFNDKDETQTIDYITELIKRHRPTRVQVEVNSIGSVFYGLLDKAIKANRLPVMLLRFTTTNESKEKLINNFQVAIQNNAVSILNDKTLLTQLDMYECKVSPTKKRIYNAATGYHDDCVISTLLAYDCISRGQYIIK